jgi:hypothetical protein
MLVQQLEEIGGDFVFSAENFLWDWHSEETDLVAFLDKLIGELVQLARNVDYRDDRVVP